MNYFNKNDEHIARQLIALAGIEGGIITLINALITDYKTIISLAVVVILTFIMILLKEKIFKLIINFTNVTENKMKIKKGKWLLQISFDDENQVKQNISGACTINYSLSGVKIYGNKLLDNVNGNPRKENWIAESAEILNQNDKDILIYLYKTPTDASDQKKYDEMSFDKVGLVVATKGNDGVYRGKFRDIPLLQTEKIREGDVVLTFSE